MTAGRREQAEQTDLTQLLTSLADAGVRFVLVGGLAAVAQGAPVMTFDIDIVHERSDDNVDRLLDVLRRVGARYRGRPDLLEPSRQALLGAGHQLLITSFGPLDVLGSVERGLTYEQLLADAIALELEGRRLHVLRLEKLLELKQQWDDDESRARAALYRRALEHLDK